ncbi:hypothetical protein, partial [uncultured Capnocytophaga sp.]|uniref:hypothetical protein n=1 Tax=uncultured Capnocytophaga sp. TaxID=159273 RepID=UPI002591344C
MLLQKREENSIFSLFHKGIFFNIVCSCKGNKNEEIWQYITVKNIRIRRRKREKMELVLEITA